jgi:hypothetical protein
LLKSLKARKVPIGCTISDSLFYKRAEGFSGQSVSTIDTGASPGAGARIMRKFPACLAHEVFLEERLRVLGWGFVANHIQI